jgi:PAS domain S-box-containing protein
MAVIVNYLLFHSFSELFSISVAGCVFAVTWNTRTHRSRESSFFLLIGIASLFVGGMDLVHTLAYKGMNVIPGYDADLPTQLWIASRYLQSLSFLAASGLLFLNKSGGRVLSPGAPYWMLTGYAVITGLLLFAIFARIFPVCFIEGSGLTPFKRISEYVICIFLTGAAVLLRKSRGHLDQEMLGTLMAAIVFSILTELAFSLYTDVYGLFAILGHILKVVVFLTLYRAVVQIGIKKPYTLLARDLYNSEIRYRTIVENSYDALFIQDFNGNITDVNRHACRMLEYSRDELVGAHFSTFSTPNAGHYISERITTLGNNDILLFESEAIRKDGTRLPTEFSVSAVSREGNGILYVLARDITERKRAEAELRESEVQFRTIFNVASVGIVQADSMTGEILRCNETYCRITGYPLSELIGVPFTELVHPEDRERDWDIFSRAARGETPGYYNEKRYIRKGGGIIWARLNAAFVRDSQGRAIRTVAVCEDITEHKQAEESLRESEEALRALLSEKEVLLKEVHHRVKNNLQVMSSLISLQADSLADDQLQGVLSDMRGRIKTMALVYEKLYQTEDMAQLNFAEYAAGILQHLRLAQGPATHKVSLNLSAAPLFLSTEKAVPCGLILNELAGNAIKHAFPGGSGCEVSVVLEHDPATGAVCLRVRDNGVGLSADLDWRQSTSLGLRLVQMLAGQLNGTVQTGPSPGTEFLVNFKV